MEKDKLFYKGIEPIIEFLDRNGTITTDGDTTTYSMDFELKKDAEGRIYKESKELNIKTVIITRESRLLAQEEITIEDLNSSDKFIEITSISPYRNPENRTIIGSDSNKIYLNKSEILSVYKYRENKGSK